jgi:hypothetical protein
LKRNGLCYRCSRVEQARESNPSWKGGRLQDYLGYIRILFHGHPKADKSGYVKEHILVLERKIGRNLLSNEQVHHINGIKSDNSSENLELYNKSEHMRLHRKNTPRDWHGRFMKVVA